VKENRVPSTKRFPVFGSCILSRGEVPFQSLPSRMERMYAGSPVPARTKSVLTSQDHLARRAARNSRVHFDEDGYIPPQLLENNPILVQVTGEERSKTIGVYLGFLQEEHMYEVKFHLPFTMTAEYLPINSSSHTTLSAVPSSKIECPKDGLNLKEDNSHSLSTTGGSSGATKAKTKRFLDNLEVFNEGEVCEVTEVECRGEPPALLLHITLRVPSTEDQHVLEDSFCIRSALVENRFVRVNVAAKIMGKTMGTPTLKDGIKCVGVCPKPHESSGSESSDDDNEVDMADVVDKSDSHK